MVFHNRFVCWAAAGLVFAAALFIYILTLAPTVVFLDSGELILAAFEPGIPHPPGFPLYVLLGHIFSRIPFSTPAFRLNFMSAFFAAQAAAGIFLILFNNQNRKAATPARRLIAALAAALSFAFSRTFWTWAVQAEVYTLGGFLIAALIAALLAWRRRAGAGGKEAADRWCYLTGFLFGLGLANHHLTVLLLAPAFFYLIIRTAGWRFLIGKRLIFALSFCLLGLSLYLYLPFRSAADPLLNWGDPSTPARFLRHVLGGQYRAISAFSSARLIEQVGQLIGTWIGQCTAAGAVLALIGLWKQWKRDRPLCRFFLLIVLTNVVFVLARTSLYILNTDIEAWYLPAFIVTAIWLGGGIAAVLDWAARKGRGFVRLASVIVLFFPLLPLAANFHRCDLSDYYLAVDYAENTLKGLEPDAVILTRDWRLSGPLLYLQHAEGVRPDVAVIDCEMVRGRWYGDYLERRLPGVLGAVSEEFSLYRRELERYEQGVPGVLQRLRYRYGLLMNALIRATLEAARPVYLTVPMEEEVGSEAEFQWVPSGLAFRLYPRKGEYPLPSLEGYRYRGLADGTVFLNREARELRKQYALMLTARGSYLESQGRRSAAVGCYRHALELEPGFELARSLLRSAASRKEDLIR